MTWAQAIFRLLVFVVLSLVSSVLSQGCLSLTSHWRLSSQPIIIIIIVYFRHKVHRNYNKTAQRTDKKGYSVSSVYSVSNLWTSTEKYYAERLAGRTWVGRKTSTESVIVDVLKCFLVNKQDPVWVLVTSLSPDWSQSVPKAILGTTSHRSSTLTGEIWLPIRVLYADFRSRWNCCRVMSHQS